jgi:hypothetical protein
MGPPQPNWPPLELVILREAENLLFFSAAPSANPGDTLFPNPAPVLARIKNKTQ